MLYVQEKVAKLGDIFLGGQVSSVEIQESAAIYVAQDDKGQVKKTQPVGYDNAKVIIDIILEDSPEETSLEQLTNMQRLFRANGQTQAKLLTIVNEDCAARDIFQVYFKSLSSKKVISESRRIVSWSFGPHRQQKSQWSKRHRHQKVPASLPHLKTSRHYRIRRRKVPKPRAGIRGVRCGSQQAPTA